MGRFSSSQRTGLPLRRERFTASLIQSTMATFLVWHIRHKVAGLDFVGKQLGSVRVDHPDDTGPFGFEGLVVRSVLLCFLGHESNICDIAHGGDIEGSMLLAEIDRSLINPGVIAIWYHRFGVLEVPVSPHI